MPGKKQDNRRVYPDATRQPRHLDSLRKSEAKERQAVYDKLSLQEKIDRLPATGATKQRARLLTLLEKKKNQPAVDEQKARAERLQKSIDTAVSGDAAPTDNPREMTDRAAANQRKKYMKGAK